MQIVFGFICPDVEISISEIFSFCLIIGVRSNSVCDDHSIKDMHLADVEIFQRVREALTC